MIELAWFLLQCVVVYILEEKCLRRVTKNCLTVERGYLPAGNATLTILPTLYDGAYKTKLWGESGRNGEGVADQKETQEGQRRVG